MYLNREEMPKVFGAKNIAFAMGLHALLFIFLWYMGVLGPGKPDEVAIPIELSVVAVENLDGNEDEPPPEREPEPEPPPEPDPVPPPEPDPPPPPPPVPDESVIKVPDEKPPEPPKPPEEVKPPKPPEKTPEQMRKEREEARRKRIEEMKKSATDVKETPPPPRPRSNGRTERRPPNWKELLNAGYKPAAVNSGLDADESQRCVSLIYNAFHEKWSPPPWTPELRRISLQVAFDRGGGVKSYRLTASSGDRRADATVLEAAARVGRVYGLTSAFIERNPTVTVNFDVKPL